MNENKLEDSKGFAALLRLVRPKQWIKNGFIFLPLFFGGALLHTDALLAGLITFFAYSFAASSIYCFNDIFDVEADRRHPLTEFLNAHEHIQLHYMIPKSIVSLLVAIFVNYPGQKKFVFKQ